VQISLEGPFDIFYVNRADDPQAKTAIPSDGTRRDIAALAGAPG
jgi:hypothetical protein